MFPAESQFKSTNDLQNFEDASDRNTHFFTELNPLFLIQQKILLLLLFLSKVKVLFFFYQNQNVPTFGLVRQLSLIQPFKSWHVCHFLLYVVYIPTNLLNFFFDFLLFEPSSLKLEVDTGRWAGNSGRIGLPAEWSFQQRSSCTNLMQFIPRSKYFW